MDKHELTALRCDSLTHTAPVGKGGEYHRTVWDMGKKEGKIDR